MEGLNAATPECCRTGRPFGVPPGSFQRLQHGVVHLFIALDEAPSPTQPLTLSVQDGDTDLSGLAAGAEAPACKAARFVGGQAAQLHGGMSMSDESIIGHHPKRLAAISIQFGDSTHHPMRFARRVLDIRHGKTGGARAGTRNRALP